jgi:hypothetical protein
MQPEVRSETPMRLAFKIACFDAPESPLRNMIVAKLKAGVGLSTSKRGRPERS